MLVRKWSRIYKIALAGALATMLCGVVVAQKAHGVTLAIIFASIVAVCGAVAAWSLYKDSKVNHAYYEGLSEKEERELYEKLKRKYEPPKGTP